MRYLFVHQNFPAQYRHVAPVLAADAKHEVVAIGETKNMAKHPELHPGIKRLGYRLDDQRVTTENRWLKDVESAVIRGQQVARIAYNLRSKGFRPDVIAGHPGWGETLYLRDIWPDARIISYCEFYYQGNGADVGFDPEFPQKSEDPMRLRSRNFTHLSAIESADVGICPTQWQRSLFPASMQSKIEVVHEGINTFQVKPDPTAALDIDGRRYAHGDPVVTYIARNLEPYRGFHVFMRALPELLAKNAQVRVLVVGGDDVSYSRRAPNKGIYRELLQQELGDRVDWQRVQFVGKVPYATYLKILQVSAVHIYLTYPFVLSWSLLEAMSAGCLIVASNTQPLHEVIKDGVNGLYTDFFDIHRIADKIGQCISDPGRFAPLRDQARRTVINRFDLESYCLPRSLALLKGD